ncbi:MAG: hypothetical protein CMJ51_05110 [Planctomycetaceae bacterium]|nr:hypothetical protein [Planctomycetaceae bacterium]
MESAPVNLVSELIGADPSGVAAESPAMTPFITLSLAIAFGLVVAILHLLAHRERPIYSLWRTLLLIAPLIAMSTMAVGSNLAAAFTLFGTLAIVRFRTPIKDPLDAAFVIFSVVIGLALGNGSLHVATVGTAMIAALILALLAVNRVMPRENRSTLKLVISDLEASESGWRTVLDAEGIRIRIDSCVMDQDRKTQTIKLSLSGISGDRWPGLLSELLTLPEVKHASGRTDED